MKPTVGSDRVLIETWMTDYSGVELYGKSIDVHLIENIQSEKSFLTSMSLKTKL